MRWKEDLSPAAEAVGEHGGDGAAAAIELAIAPDAPEGGRNNYPGFCIEGLRGVHEVEVASILKSALRFTKKENEHPDLAPLADSNRVTVRVGDDG